MNSTEPTLVILAAGMGRRYGGLKQLESLGPGGGTIMDYSIFDALRAGFGKLVFVIRAEMEESFHEAIGRRYAARVEVAYAHQQLEALPDGFTPPPNREKPWGTAHAVLAARERVPGPFVVINADDFYGADTFRALGEFLNASRPGGVPTYAMVGYRLRNTMSAAGTVSRGICRAGKDGWLEQIVETVGIARQGENGRFTDPDGNEQILPGDTLVSMNIWGFTTALFDQLQAGFEAFLREHGASRTVELYLPTVIQDAIRDGQVRVRVLQSECVWCGITNPEDRDIVAGRLREWTERGEYPAALWD